MVILLVILNAAISAFNAWSVGKVWLERQAMGWMGKLSVYAGAIMSVCGFVWVYLVIECVGLQAYKAHPLNISMLRGINNLVAKMPAGFVDQVFSLGYLIIILPILGSGLVLAAEAWTIAWRHRNAANMGVAIWNTFAQLYNTVQLIQVLPDVLGNLGDLFEGDDDEERGWVKWALPLVFLAIVGGLLTTSLIIRRSAAAHRDALDAKLRSRHPEYREAVASS